jgi:hypothetical protein
MKDQAEERKIKSKSIRRPDASVQRIVQGRFQKNLAFIKVKPHLYLNRKQPLIIDLYCLCHFGKDSLDVGSKKTVLIQIIGERTHWTILFESAKAFYLTFKICSFDIPIVANNLMNTIMSLKGLCRKSMLLQDLSSKNNNENEHSKEWSMDSFGTPILNNIVETITYKEEFNFSI